MSLSPILTILIFAFTYLGLAFGKLPLLRIDRAGIALAGLALMLALGQTTLSEAIQSVDYPTLILLFGMMVVVACLKLSGFFDLATELFVAKCSHSATLLAVIIGLVGLLSAFLVNDVVCLAFTPLILNLCQRLKKPIIPFLVALATAANIGSVATITGNPQNMIIGSLSGIPYARFAYRLSPIAIVGLGINFLVIAFVYRKTLFVVQPNVAPVEKKIRLHRALLIKSITITLLSIVFFFLGKPTAAVALIAAAALFLDRIRPEKIYRQIDWTLLLMFAGLFAVVHAFEVNVVHSWSIERWDVLIRSPVVCLSALSVGLSNLVSNVPAVLLFKPLINAIPEKEKAWLALAMSSTLAGNLTILGSVANLIVVESAQRAGTKLSFFEYLKVGIPVTFLTTLIGIAWLL